MSKLKDFVAKLRTNAAAAREHSENHCGGCRHDCELEDPGCGVGKEASTRKKIKEEKRAARAHKHGKF